MSGYNTLPETGAIGKAAQHTVKTDAEGAHSTAPKSPSAKQAETMTETHGEDVGQDI